MLIKHRETNWRKELSFLKNNNFWFEKPLENLLNNNVVYLNWYTSIFTSLSLFLIPEVSGVYIIQNNNGFIYVGQSENLRRRMFEHAFKETNLLLRFLMEIYEQSIVVKWAEVPKYQLNGVEKYLCNRLNPICNHILPPGNKEIPCNLPI